MEANCVSLSVFPREIRSTKERRMMRTEAHFNEEAMESHTTSKESVRLQLNLTDEQRNQVRDAFGTDSKAIELAIEPLEDRVAPIIAILIRL